MESLPDRSLLREGIKARNYKKKEVNRRPYLPNVIGGLGLTMQLMNQTITTPP